jgi:bifunctional non-homologous end joining protein LigD
MLETYTKKRNFSKTSEPAGRRKAESIGALAFVVQKHSASRLHYDFRLECAGVLLSWAVPKGPSLDPASKRLAVMVEDHPLDYADFEGIIPAGQYGGGEVIVWDNGTYCPDSLLDENASRKKQENTIEAGLKKGKLSFTLFGKKLQGSWTLVRTKRSAKDWLLIKHTDQFADTDHEITKKDVSVISKKTIASLEKANPDRRNRQAEKAEPEVAKNKTKSAKQVTSIKSARAKVVKKAKTKASKTTKIDTAKKTKTKGPSMVKTKGPAKKDAKKPAGRPVKKNT